MSFQITRNTLSPALAAIARRLSDKRPLLEAMALSLVSVTKRAFRDDSLRPAPWAPVKKTSGAALRQSGALFQSIAITGVTQDEARVGTDRPYARYHQFGTDPFEIRPKTKKALFWAGAAHPVGKVSHPGLPPRPFFPFGPDGDMTPRGQAQIEAAARRKLASLLRVS
jgi:phage gpG-like protein